MEAALLASPLLCRPALSLPAEMISIWGALQGFLGIDAIGSFNFSAAKLNQSRKSLPGLVVGACAMIKPISPRSGRRDCSILFLLPPGGGGYQPTIWRRVVPIAGMHVNDRDGENLSSCTAPKIPPRSPFYFTIGAIASERVVLVLRSVRVRH